MESEDGTGGRRPWLGDVDCHPPISFKYNRQVTLFSLPACFIFLYLIVLKNSLTNVTFLP